MPELCPYKNCPRCARLRMKDETLKQLEQGKVILLAYADKSWVYLRIVRVAW